MDSRYTLPANILHSLAPVEHRREFDHHSLGFFRQFIDDFEHIRRTVSNAISASSVFIPSGRIDKNEIGWGHRMQIVYAVTIHHLYLLKP